MPPALRDKLELLKDYAEDLRSVTWLAPVSAAEMNIRDRWLADELDKIADSVLAALPEGRDEWQPISSAPRDVDAWFWIRPKNADEMYCNTSGEPMVSKFEPYAKVTQVGRWSAAATATHWMPFFKPGPPEIPTP